MLQRRGLITVISCLQLSVSFRDVTPEERYEERLKRSKPILDEFYSYLKYHMPRVLPKSVLGGAIRYCLKPVDKLQHFY